MLLIVKKNLFRAGRVVGLFLLASSWVIAQEAQEAQYVGAGRCAECHQEISTQFTRSVHARLQPFELNGRIAGCESCHGPGGNHVESLDPSDVFRYGQAPSHDIEENCLGCHQRKVGLFWSHGEHSLAGVDCTNCHTIHQSRPSLPLEPGMIERTSLASSHAQRTAPPPRASLSKPEPQLCMDCHRDVGARMLLPSHHPVREGKMDCTSCHQVHGSEVGMLDSAEGTNALCAECHASKQGPFVFEHPPVVEDCATCHVAHGSVANNLLKQNEPFLCLQCHEAHFHIGRSGISDPISRPTGSVTNRFGEAGWRVAFGTKCSQCHQAVHGSDLPSQSVTSQGKSLTR